MFKPTGSFDIPCIFFSRRTCCCTPFSMFVHIRLESNKDNADFLTLPHT